MTDEKCGPTQENRIEPCPICAKGWKPNEETLAAMRELEVGRGHRSASVEQLIEDLNGVD